MKGIAGPARNPGRRCRWSGNFTTLPRVGADESRPAPLDASWVFDERDLALAAKLVPGASLAVLRWPVAFFIAYVGVGLSQGPSGWLFVIVSAGVIASLWSVALFGLRGSQIRKFAKQPEDHRRVRISLQAGIFRLEDASGRASEWPLRDVDGAIARPEGVLFRLGNRVQFVPARALGDDNDAWRVAFALVPRWTRPIGAGFTYGLWTFATLIGLYGFLK